MLFVKGIIKSCSQDIITCGNAQTLKQHSLHFPSNFPLKKLPKRLLLAQNLTEFEKQNIECSIVSLCLSSSSVKSLTLSKLMKAIKSSYFDDVKTLKKPE